MSNSNHLPSHKINNSNHLRSHRTDYSPTKEDLISFAPDGSFTRLPSTVTDPIAVNNIASMEFDSTEKIDDDSDPSK